MPSLNDLLARGAAAGDVLGGGAPPGDTGETEPPIEPRGPSPVEDIESGLALIEGALAQAPPELAEKARNLVNGIREVAQEIQVAGPAAPVEEEAPPGALPEPPLPV